MIRRPTKCIGGAQTSGAGMTEHGGRVLRRHPLHHDPRPDPAGACSTHPTGFRWRHPMSDGSKALVVERADDLWRSGTRRSFLKLLGMSGTIVLAPALFAACDDDDITGPGSNAQAKLDLSTDIGIFNYAYALEQLEAAFYSTVVGAANFATLFPDANERELLTDIRNHELVHREFLRQALGAAAIPDLQLNSTTVTA